MLADPIQERSFTALQLLSKVGMLAGSIDYETVLSEVAKLAIPELADWSLVDVVEDGVVRRGRVAHRDPQKAALVEELLRFQPNRYLSPEGQAVLEGRSLLVENIGAQLKKAGAHDAELHAILRRLGARSVLVVPFVVLGTTVAVATFVRSPESGRAHGPDDLALAEELARRAGQIVENARLHQQLRQREERLTEALAFRDQMMGVLGHDLRNPLGAVRGLSGLLQLSPDLQPKVREGLERIDHATRRMAEMIETLLDFLQSRHGGALPVERAAMDLVEVSRGVVDELKIAHPGREIHVEAPGELRGAWDPARMAQVVSNLVGNALTHGAADAPVELRLASDGVEALLEVSNRGPAIPPELAGRLFEPFLRGDGRGEKRGLGLGLYIVRQIVTAHDGTITVRSDHERTTFSVRLRHAA